MKEPVRDISNRSLAECQDTWALGKSTSARRLHPFGIIQSIPNKSETAALTTCQQMEQVSLSGLSVANLSMYG